MKSLFTKSGLVAPKSRRFGPKAATKDFFFFSGPHILGLGCLRARKEKTTGVSELLTKTKSQIKNSRGGEWVVEISTAPSRNGGG